MKDSFDPHIKYKVSWGSKFFFSGMMFGLGIVLWRFNFLTYTGALGMVGQGPVDNMDWTPNSAVWGPIFRRNLTGSEETSLLSLLELIGNISTIEEGIDCRLWPLSKEGTFTGASFFEVLSSDCDYPRQLNFLWKSKAPPRVLQFGWLALWGSILTMDNLRRQNMMIISTCPLFLAVEKTVDHIY